MKRIQQAGFLALAIVTIAIILFWHHPHSTGTSDLEKPVVTNDTSSTIATPPVQAASNQGMQIATQQASEPSQQQITSPGSAAEAWSEQVHQPISFYGMVVDENEAAVSGANIRFIWTHYVSQEATYETNALSDGNGMFSLQGVVGATLTVDVTKQGYYPVKSSNPTSFSYSQTFGSHPFQPDPNRPVVFHLRKKGTGVDLISSTLNVKIPRDGTPVNVDFLNKSFGASGQSQVSQLKPPYESWKTATAWSFRMTIPGGGFVEEDDEFPFEAPDGGYQSTIEFDFKINQPDWKTNVRKSYYFVFGNPPCYGHLDIENDIRWSGARITYAVNPDGSRNLEPK